MKKLTDDQWRDVRPRIVNRSCPVCGHSVYTEPNYGEIGSVSVLTVSCCKCGHVEIYDVAELARIADDIDKEYRDAGWR